MKIIYFATSNQHKLLRLQKIFTQIDQTIRIDFIPKYIDIDENGQNGLENSLLKVSPYRGKYHYPIIAGDTSVFFAGENFDPTHVRRIALQNHDEKNLNQNEIAQIMNNYYIQLATKYGGQKPFYYEDSWTMLMPDNTIKQTTYRRDYILTNTPFGPIDIYFPMRNLYISTATGRHTIDQSDQDFFLEFTPQITAFRKLIA